MTTNNPPIAAWAPSTALAKLASRHNNAPCVLTDTPAQFNDVALVRLSDYEALQAAYEEELFQVRQDRDTHFGELMRAIEQVDALQAECGRLNRYYKNGIDCFANPCERHSGERTPPFSEFFERYGGQCLICVVDSNKTLQADNALLRAAIRRLCNLYEVDDYYMGQLREERLDAAVNRAIEQVKETNHENQ